MARVRKDSVRDMPFFDTEVEEEEEEEMEGRQSPRELFSALGKLSTAPVAEEEAETDEDMSVLLVSATCMS